jgi:serine/threonine-protein kinase RsbW
MIAIPPESAHVRVVRRVAGAAARRGRLPDDLVEDVRLAVSEAVTRVVLRHNRAGVADDVVVRLRDDPESFEVEITDCTSSDLPDTDDGLSLALMTAVAPHSSITPSPDGQQIRLAWPVDDSAA